jgi:RHS repeat-associated protein
VGNFWDDLVDETEDLVHGGEQFVGRTVDEVANLGGNLLKDVGLNSWGDALKRFGDNIADQLGATPGEKQLGETNDPKELVHGDAGALTSAGGKVAAFQQHFEQAGNGLKAVSVGDFTGESADAYHRDVNAEVPKWFAAADACGKAAKAFGDMAAAVTWAQSQAAEAIRLWNEGHQKHDEWQKKADARNHAVDEYNSGHHNVTIPADPGADPGPALLDHARDTLKKAREHRNEVGDKVAGVWNGAAGEAPPMPPGSKRVLADLSDLKQAGQTINEHITVGFIGGLTGLVKTVRTVDPTNPFNVTHPAEYLRNVSAVEAGLTDVAAHPQKLVTGLIGTGWSTDPAQSAGTLLANLMPIGPPGAGVAADLAKVGLRDAAETGLRSAARDAGEAGLRDGTSALGDAGKPPITSHTPIHEPPVETPRPTAGVPDTAPHPEPAPAARPAETPPPPAEGARPPEAPPAAEHPTPAHPDHTPPRDPDQVVLGDHNPAPPEFDATHPTNAAPVHEPATAPLQEHGAAPTHTEAPHTGPSTGHTPPDRPGPTPSETVTPTEYAPPADPPVGPPHGDTPAPATDQPAMGDHEPSSTGDGARGDGGDGVPDQPHQPGSDAPGQPPHADEPGAARPEDGLDQHPAPAPDEHAPAPGQPDPHQPAPTEPAPVAATAPVSPAGPAADVAAPRTPEASPARTTEPTAARTQPTEPSAAKPAAGTAERPTAGAKPTADDARSSAVAATRDGHVGEPTASRPGPEDAHRPTAEDPPPDHPPREGPPAADDPGSTDPDHQPGPDEHSPHDGGGDDDAPLFDESGAGYPQSYPLPPESAVRPPHDGAFFWSGKDADGVGVGPVSAGGDGSSVRFAEAHSGTVLEDLLERNGVEAPKWSPGDVAAQKWWSDVSDMYAGNVTGEVRAVVGSQLRPGNIWQSVELPRLMDNPAVTRIVEIDAGTGAERVLFDRSAEHPPLGPVDHTPPGHSPSAPTERGPPGPTDHGPTGPPHHPEPARPAGVDHSAEHGTSHHGDDPHGHHQVPDNGHDPVSQAERDRGLGDEARHPASSNEPGDRCPNGEPVDMATGEYFLPMADVELPGVLPLALTRQHRSQYRRGVWFGPSWTSTFDARAVVTEDGVTTVDADGTMLHFDHPDGEEPSQPRHGRNWLLFSSPTGGYRLLSQDSQRSYHFEPKPGLNGTDLAVGNIAISAITDRHGNRILFHYTDNGIPEAVVHSGGYRIDVASDGSRITGYDLIDPSADAPVAVRRFTFAAGDLSAVTDGCGATTSFGYDQHHQMVGWTDSRGARYENVYDADGRVTSQQGTGGVWSGTFDFVQASDGRVTTYTDAYGARTVYEFDADLRPRRVMDPESRLTTTDFNQWRDPLEVIDPAGAVTRYSYTEDGDVAEVTDALGAVTRFGYLSPHHPNHILREGHSPVSLTYDPAGNVVAVTSDEATRRYEYDAVGALIAAVDEEGRRTDITVNAAGLPVRLTDARGYSTTVEYDAFGRSIAVTDPHGYRTIVARDPEGRVLQRIAADGGAQSWRYDGEGNCISHVDELGAHVQFEYGFYDKVTARIAPDGSRTEFRYDQARRLVEVVDPQGLTWRYTYYRDGRLQSQTDFNGASTTYRYDAAGRLAERTNAEGQSIRYRYDEIGRPVAEVTAAATESDPFADEVTRFGHSTDGDLAEAANVHGTGTYARDRVTGVQTATWNGHVVGSSINAAGQLVGVTSPSGVRTEYGYDDRGMLAALTAAGRQVALSTDAAGWITRTDFGRLTVDREFDPLGRLLTQASVASAEGVLNLGSTGTPIGALQQLSAASYDYRADGALTAHTAQPGNGSDALRTDYALDALGRVTSTSIDGTVTEQYGYDATNNIVTARTADQPSGRWDYRGTLLTDDGRSRYTYDRAGRLTRTVTKRLGRKPEVWHYQWDAYDRLRRVSTPDGHTWTYGYDTASRRTHKTNTSTGETVTFTWLGDQLLEQTTAHPTDVEFGATITWSYLPGAPTPLTQTQTTPNGTGPHAGDVSVDVPLQIGGCAPETAPSPDADVPPPQWSRADVDREFYAIVTDHLGTPTQLIDPASAAVAARATVSLWGRTTWDGSASTPLRFPGQYFDDETGWHYNRYRYYQPHTGRYASPDPLGLAPAPNPHTYPANPTTRVDPLGLAPIEGCESGNQVNPRDDGAEFPPSTHGYGVNDPPARLYGPWTQEDLARMMNGGPPRSYDFPQLHHADQMPGSAIHEVPQEIHRRPELHPNAFNQGVTNTMRQADRNLHWMMRAMEMGWIKK